MSSQLSSLYFDALSLAVVAHHGQLRKGTTLPYITHPIRVAKMAYTYGMNEQYIIAALLHDVLEDTIITPERLQPFGRVCVNAVQALTNPSKLHPQLPRAARKQMDRDHLRQQIQPVRMLKLMDRIDNVRELPKDQNFWPVYRDESLALLADLTGTHEELEQILEGELTLPPVTVT